MNKLFKNIYIKLSKSINDLFNHKWTNYFGFLIGVLFITILFFIISKWTPLAGDDWGYAINGMNNNPWNMAVAFYQSWSGRFFSELWGFVIAPNKSLWNILNTAFFMLIFVFSMLLTSSKKNYFVSGLLILMLMLRVNSDLRMETYTWIMGSTYIIPLLLIVIYLYLIERKVIYNKNVNMNWLLLITGFICFYVGLTVENAAAIMIVAQIILVIYYFYYQHRLNLFLVINMIISIVSFVIMRLSPGSTFRLLRDHAVWNQQPILTKIINNIPNLIKYTFIDNRYLIFALSFVLFAIVVKKTMKKLNTRKLLFNITLMIYLVSSLVVIGANKLVNDFDVEIMKVFFELDNVVVWIYWLIYICVVFTVVYLYIDNIKIRQKIIFFIIIGGSANLAMLMSPIFGARSSIYLVYFIMFVVVLAFNELNINDGILKLSISFVLLLMITLSAKDYLLKYSQVNQIHHERLAIIDYYLDNPDIKNIHIPRMPPYSVHGADIEDGDDYHFETFKAYYGLAMDANIVFEWKESYD